MNQPIDPRNPPEHIYRVPAYYRSRFGRMTPRVIIGATYRPAIRITPAVEIYRRAAPSALAQVGMGLLAVAGFLAFVGLTHLVFG